MLVWASTVIRNVGAGQPSGRVLLLDLDGQARIVREIRVPESDWRPVDPNPRGGTRGVRWVAALGDRVVTATYAAVHVFDADDALVRTVEHPLLSYVHCVVPDDRGLWVTATAADRIVRLDWSGTVISQWQAANSPALDDAPDVLPPDVLTDYRDPTALAARLHAVTQLNRVVVRDGTLWANLGMVLTRGAAGSDRDFSGLRPPGWRPSASPVASSHAIVRLNVRPDDSLGGDVLCWRQPTSRWPNHDLLPLGEEIWFNDTDTGHLTSVAGGQVRARIRVRGDFLRGLAGLEPGRALVGTQNPLRIHEADLARRRITRSWDLPGSPDESITCLAGVAG